MSAKLVPGSFNLQTLANRQAREDAGLEVVRSQSLGHDRYGRSVGHRCEAGMDDTFVDHAAPVFAQSRHALPSQPISNLTDTRKLKGILAA